LYWTVCKYILSQSYANTHDISILKERATCEIVRDSIFDSLADVTTPQGIFAVCKQMQYKLEDLLSHQINLAQGKQNNFYLIGENLNDPGNIGTLIRTAAAAGATGVVLTTGSADIYNPKVIRASAGAMLRLPIVVNMTIKQVAEVLKAREIPIYAAHPRGTIFPYDLNLQESFCFLLGNESHGISEEATMYATSLVTLPMPGDTESLNVSIAGCVLLYESVRQRLHLSS